MAHFNIKTTVRGSLPRIPFEQIARTILGDRYDLSVVICADALARRVLLSSRADLKGKPDNYTPNVLSFPLDKQSGELFLNASKAAREAKEMNISLRERIAHLYVHGCFHLAGYDHSDTMERHEDRILSRFKLVS
ncbi:rRNA maturation RNase YbeY [Candidatus Kaiserbacteria bacterium]|nr:rRNA maturation RNase YbeY [Candidatus Kaiserbacteria bacterium]